MVGAILVRVGSPGGGVAGSEPLQIRIGVGPTFPQGYLSLRYNAKDHVLGSQPAAANLLKSQATGTFAAHAEAIDYTYLVGSPVVRERAEHWSLYQDTVPAAKPKAESNPLEFSSTGASGVQWFLTVSKTQPIPIC